MRWTKIHLRSTVRFLPVFLKPFRYRNMSDDFSQLRETCPKFEMHVQQQGKADHDPKIENQVRTTPHAHGLCKDGGVEREPGKVESGASCSKGDGADAGGLFPLVIGVDQY